MAHISWCYICDGGHTSPGNGAPSQITQVSCNTICMYSSLKEDSQCHDQIVCGKMHRGC